MERRVAVHRPTACGKFATAIVAVGFVVAAVSAAAEEKIDWKIGLEFRRQLESTVGVNWTENPLRPALTRLAQTQQTAIFLDRRIDPDQRIDFRSRDESFELVLARLSAHLQVGKSTIGPVIYFGPTQTAETLATVAALRRQEAGALPNAAKARWLQQQPLQWAEPTNPQQLVRQLYQAGAFTLANPELLPYDLWAAGDLPPLPLCDRLTLLLAGFGLTYAFENGGAAVRLLPLPKTASYRHVYTAKGDAARLTAELQRMFPTAEIETRADKIAVTSRYEDHEKIERLLRGEKVKTVRAAPGEKRFTLKVENQPAGAVARAIAKELGKELKYDPAILDKLKQSVNFAVNDATLDELLEATLEPLGLQWRLSEATLEVLPAD